MHVALWHQLESAGRQRRIAFGHALKRMLRILAENKVVSRNLYAYSIIYNAIRIPRNSYCTLHFVFRLRWTRGIWRCIVFITIMLLERKLCVRSLYACRICSSITLPIGQFCSDFDFHLRHSFFQVFRSIYWLFFGFFSFFAWVLPRNMNRFYWLNLTIFWDVKTELTDFHPNRNTNSIGQLTKLHALFTLNAWLKRT